VRIGLVVAGGVDRSGRERVTPALLWLLERLARRHDVHVFVLDYSAEPCTYPLAGATIHDVGRVGGPPGLRRWRLRARLGRAVAAVDGVDVLHAYMGVPAGIASVFVGRAARIPVVATFDSGELVAVDDLQYGLQRRWLDRLSIDAVQRMAARVTVCTGYMRRRPALHARAEIVPIGIDRQTFTGSERRDGPPWRLVRVASINRVKDFPLLLRAFRLVVSRIHDVHLDIAGEDTLGGAMQALAQSLGLSRQVAFHGALPIERVASLYADAHLHVSTSRHEAAGVATLEAACAGVPTVGTRVGYIDDWTADADAASARAVGVAVNDPAALADAIVGLLTDPKRRSQIAANARAWATAHDADWTAHRFEQIYGDVRSSGAGSR